MRNRRCKRCGGRLEPILDVIELGPPERKVIVNLPAWRCDPCGITRGAVTFDRFHREDDVVELLVRQRPWQEIDAAQDSNDADADDSNPEFATLDELLAVNKSATGLDQATVLDGSPLSPSATAIAREG